MIYVAILWRGDNVLLSVTDEFKRIRRLRHDDVPYLMEWDNDPELFELTGKKFSLDDNNDDWWASLVRDRTRLVFAIVDDLGQLIGDVELLQIVWRAREAEVRISIGDKQYWNHGYGTEALRETLGAAFQMLSLKRVYLRVRSDNERAIHSYRKAGFRRVARLAATGRLRGCAELQLMEMTRTRYSLGPDRALRPASVLTPRS